MQAVEYRLQTLLSSSDGWERYAGMTLDGMPVEILLVRGTALGRSMTAAEDDAAATELWTKLEQRAAILALTSGALFRRPLAYRFADPVGFVLMTPMGDRLSDRLSAGANALTVSLALSIIRCATAACAEAHALGLCLGRIESTSLSQSNEGQWQVDPWTIGSQVWDDSVTPEQDMAGLGQLINDLTQYIAADEPRREAVVTCLRQLGNACQDSDDLARPTALEVASRLSEIADAPAFDHSSTLQVEVSVLETPASSQPGTDVTQEVDVQAQSASFGAGVNSPTSHIDIDIDVGPRRTTAGGMLREGMRFGRYNIEARIGLGGMGAVYRAIDLASHSLVAIKVLNRQVATDSITMRRFGKEARMMARVNNPYVVNLLDVNTDGKCPYMAVEYLAGGTLGSLLETTQPIPERFAVAIITDAVRGLAIAHARGVVHRDFKPDNVLLTVEGRQLWNALQQVESTSAIPTETAMVYAKVADFGLARLGQQSQSLEMTREGALLGTPLYMSPEQCRGEQAGPASDVYSVGITLYQLLAGKPPFEGDTQVALMNKHCNEHAIAIKQLRPDVSDALAGIVEKCMAKNPEARYLTAGDLLIDLDNVLLGRPTTLGLHPPILALNDPSALTFSYSWELRSSPSQLWPYVANTDRVNHAIGLPSVSYTTRNHPSGGTERFAEATIGGQKIRWQEHPYEWIEGQRLSVLREFTQAPFKWFVNVVQLQPILGGGTRIEQKFVVSPANWLGKQLARLQLGKKSQQNFGRIYQQIDEYLSKGEQTRADRDPFVTRTAMTPAARSRLQGRLAQLSSEGIDPRVIDVLAQFLEHASDLELARMRPRAFAERFSLNEQQTIEAFLRASRLGLVELLWDVLCPSCRIPSSVQETLKSLKDHGHCEACNLGFELDLARSVEMIFRVHPEIRPVETRTWCIGGPAWSRHVVAQLRLAAGERFTCDLDLAPGAYVIRGPRLPFIIEFRVAHQGTMSRAEFQLSRPPSTRTPLVLAADSQVINLMNDGGVDQLIRIERTASAHDALTAAQATSLALFRELFPGEVLAGDQIVSVSHVTVMQVSMHDTANLYEQLGEIAAFKHVRGQLDRMLRIVKDSSGAVVKTIGEGLLASFPTAHQAITAALALLDRGSDAALPGADGSQLSVVVHTGSAMAATLDDRLDYFGNTMRLLQRMNQLADSGSLLLTARVFEHREVQAMLEQHKDKLRLHSTDEPSSEVIYEIRFDPSAATR